MAAAATGSWANVARAAAPTPEAFLCTATRKVMKDPVLALCGHLFERHIVEGNRLICPKDKSVVDDFVPCAELKARIMGVDQSADDNNTKEEEDANDAPIPLSFPSLIRNAHSDDLHGMIKLQTGEVVTGSKDASMKIWDCNGDVVQQIGGGRGYRYWITALTSLSNGNWVSGTRDGNLSCWDAEGNELSQWAYRPSQNARNTTVSKDRNKIRICCATEALGYDEPHVFTGTPRFVQLWNVGKGSLEWFHQAHDNDWVYCIDPLSENKMLVVTGPKLELWTTTRGQIRKDLLIRETRASSVSQRQAQFISSIARLESNPSLLAAARFSGSVPVLDYRTGKIVRTYREHVGRAWSVVNVDRTSFASSAEDATIKIWDTRVAKSAQTFDGYPGRVSTLLKYDDGVILAGSCPDDPHASADKGQLNLLDLRRPA